MALTPFDGELDAPVSGLAPFTGKLDGEPEGIAGWLRAATESGKAIAGDIGTGLNIGTTVDIPEQVIGINALARAMTPAGILSGMVTPQAAKDVRGKIEGVAREAIDSRRNNLSSEFSPEQQAANKKRFFTDDASWKNLTSDGILSAPGKAVDLASKGELFGEGWSDWRKPVGSAVQSAPSSLLMMTPTALASKTAAQTAIKEAAAAGLAADAAQAAGVKAAERTAMIAGGLSEGAQGAGSAYEQTRRTVLEMPEEKLRSSPFYQEQLAANGGDAKAARAKAAEAAALTSASGAFWFDALFGAIGDKYIGTAAAGKGTRTGALARGAAQETPTEFIQSGGEKLTENLAMKRFADPSQDLMQNVGEEATGGALSGAIMGAGMGAAFHRNSGIAAPGSAPPATPALLPDTGPISRSANIAIQTGATNLAAAAQAADVLGVPQSENNDTLNNQPAETSPVAPNVGPLDTAAAAADPVRAQQTDAANIPANQGTNVQSSAANQDMQNRDRTRAASVVQMQKIAQNPDYELASIARDSNGAPMVGNNGAVAPAAIGKKERVTLPDGTKISTNYAVVEADSLSPSHFADGTANAGYGKDGKLTALNNGRTAGLMQAYNIGTAGNYRAALEQDTDGHGIPREVIAGMKAPVLVRLYDPASVDQSNLGARSNQASALGLGTSEQANSDAAMIDSMDGLNPDDSGDFSTSRDFIRRFMSLLPQTEQAGMVDADGALSQSGYARVRNAILAKAYGESPVLLRMVESLDDNMRNVTKALVKVAPQVAKARAAIADGAMFDADITPDLLAAVAELSQLKSSGRSINDALAQEALFGGYSNEVRELLQFLGDNLRRPNKIADFISEAFDALAAAGSPNQGSMFGESRAPTKSELLSSAKRRTSEQEGSSLFAGDEKAGRQAGTKLSRAPGNAQGNAENAAEAQNEWVAFPPETGTLGIPRADMPQVKGTDRGALIQFLDGRDIQHKTIDVAADQLHPTQAEFSTQKAAKWGEIRDGVDRSVLISSDGYVLDGHHQWIAALATKDPIKAIVFSAPIDKLLAEVLQFPSITQSDGAKSEAGRVRARQDFDVALAELGSIIRQINPGVRMLTPEEKTRLMPTLVKLFESGIKTVGYNIKDLIADVKKAMRASADEFVRKHWNKVDEKTYREAAAKAVENSLAAKVNEQGQQNLFSAPAAKPATTTAKTAAPVGTTMDMFAALAEAAPGLREAFSLTGQTGEEASAAEADKREAEKKDAAKQAELAKKEKADVEAKDFRLAGSNRPADVAVAGGQQDLLGVAPAPTPTEAANQRNESAGRVATAAGLEPVGTIGNEWRHPTRADELTLYANAGKNGGSEFVLSRLASWSYEYSIHDKLSDANDVLSKWASEGGKQEGGKPVATKKLGKRATEALAIMQEGGYWRKALETSFIGGEKFETRLRYANGGIATGVGFKTFTEMQDAGLLQRREVPKSTVYAEEWSLREKPLEKSAASPKNPKNVYRAYPLTDADRSKLLRRFPPKYERIVADHLTAEGLGSMDKVVEGPATGLVVGESVGGGIQSLVVSVNGKETTGDGTPFHLTWSAEPGVKTGTAGTLAAKYGFERLDTPIEIDLSAGPTISSDLREARNEGETDKAFAKRVVDKRQAPASLPENHADYFIMDGATVVQVADLASMKTDEQNQQGGDNGPKRMAAAAAGELSKRAPITVMPSGKDDGKYDVVDGNGTLTSVKKYGWKSMPVTVVSRIEGWKIIHAEKANDTAKKLAEQGAVKVFNKEFVAERDNWSSWLDDAAILAAAVKKSAIDRAQAFVDKHHQKRPEAPLSPEDRARAESMLAPKIKLASEAFDLYNQLVLDVAEGSKSIGVGVMLAPLKTIKRAAVKLVNEEHWDVDGIKDFLRSTIVVRNYKDAQTVLDQIKLRFDVLRVKNRSGQPLIAPHTAVAPREKFGGYSDVLVNVVMPNGIVAEIQINAPEMLAAKSNQGHKLYEIYRDLDPESGFAKETFGEMLAFYDASFQAINSLQSFTQFKKLDSEIGAQFLGRPPAGLSDSPLSDNFINPPGGGNLTNSSPDSEAQNSQPGGNFSGTFIGSTSDSSIAGRENSAYTETEEKASEAKNEHGNNGTPGAQGKESGAVPGSANPRGTGGVRDGNGGRDSIADRQPGSADAGAREVGQPGPDDAGAEPQGGGRNGKGNRAGRNAGVPAGRDIPVKSGKNYAFGDTDLTYEGSWLVKARQNVEAVELLKSLEKDGRQATREEQAILARFIGWGASEIANTIFGNKLDAQAEALSNYEQAIENLGNKNYLTNSDYRAYLPAFRVLQSKNDALNWYTVGNITRAMLDAAKPDASAKKWIELRDRVKSAMTREEWDEASRSTQYAHYTSKPIVKAMWSALERMGFKGGTILEPGAGIGVFPGLMSHSMAANSIYTGIEFDSITGGILKQLFPDERILVESFIDSKLPAGFYDVAAGNPPFNNTAILADPKYRKFAFALHDYFFAKSIDSVKPGGLVMFVTSRYTMDKLNDKARAYLSERADLVGAIRLPQTAFKKNAGTDVVTDVLFLRKKVPGEIFEQSQPWAKSVPMTINGRSFPVNEYFHAHPEMVLGKHSDAGKIANSPDPQYTVEAIVGDIDALFEKAAANLPADIYKAERGSAAEAAAVREIDFNPKAQKEGNYYVTPAGVLMQREGGIGLRVEKNNKGVEVLKDFVALRDALKQSHYDQLNSLPNETGWEDSLAALRQTYDAFVKKHGRVNQFTETRRTVEAEDEETGEKFQDERVSRRFPLISKIQDDPDYSLVMALEKVNDDTGEITDSPFLSGRVLGKPEKQEIRTTSDALLAVLNDTGKVDIPAIAERMGIEQQEAIDSLGSLIYQDPSSTWQMADEYLSGNVKKKLRAAQEAAKSDSRYVRNVEALMAVQPAPVPASDITVSIGMNWIPAETYEQFLEEKTGVSAKVHYNERTGQWAVEAKYGNSTLQATQDWGTKRRPADEILLAALTGAPIRVTETQRSGGETKTVFLADATEAANQKLAQMRQAFGEWIWQDAARADALLQVYNDKFNTIVPRKFDGSHLTLPGKSQKWTVFDHVKRGAWRIIQAGNTYLAHAVGSGKTFQMIISAMEQKRLGLIQKPMMVVPNHMLKQFASEWVDLYPAARLMVADEKNFHTENRRRFVSRVAMSDLDGVIITHSAFKLLDLDPEFKQKMIGQELDYLRAALKEAGGEEGKKSRDPKVKQIESKIEKMEQKLEAAMSDVGKDKNVRFDQLGVDMLYVDEAHEFRKLAFTTQRQVKGIDSSGSDRAFDLWMKTRWLEEKKPGRSLVMASGTPVTNTLAELFSVQRFMAPDVLEERGLDEFDAWASMFGQENTEIESDASGKYAPVTRFSKFVNVPELTQMFREFADVLTSEHLAGLLKTRPTVKGGTRKIVITPQTAEYSEYKAALASRLDKSRAWKPTSEEPNNPDPVIKIIGDGRLAAIDMRFVNPSAPSDPDSKLNRMADEVIRVYKETAGRQFPASNKEGAAVEDIKGATQVVFSDLGFGAGVAANRGFNARAWFEKRLRDAGIPPKHVAFMADNKKSVDKLRLFKDVNAGRVRIVVGSSKNMGTGVNMQQRLAALHHLDTPWFPADLEQREGRIVRQGNKHAFDAIGLPVELYAYSTKGSYDAVMWQMLASKQRFIDQALSGDSSVRSIDDLSESSQFQIATAMTSDDPRAMQLAGVRAEVEKLQRLSRSHEENRSRMRMEYDWAGSTIEMNERKLPEAIKAAEKVVDLSGEGFRGKVGDAVFDSRKEFGDALLTRFKEFTDKLGEKKVKVGELSGFNIAVAGRVGMGNGYSAVLGIETPEAAILAEASSADAVGVAMRAINAVSAVARQPAKMQQLIEEAKNKRAALESRIAATFPMAEMLADKVKEAQDLEVAMMADQNKLTGREREQQLEDEWQKKTGAITPLLSRRSQTETPEFKRWRGSGYRAMNYNPPRGASVAEIVAYESNELGNEDIGLEAQRSAEKLGLDLAAVKASDAIWITRTFEQAQQYGDSSEIREVNVDGWIPIVDLGKEGALLIKPQPTAIGNNGLFDPNNPDITMSRGNAAGMAIRDLQAAVDRVSRGFKNLPKVHVFASPADLSTKDPAQKSLRDFIRKAGAWEDVEGATHAGEIYLFASGLSDEARAEHVLATHEVTHYGLRGAIGKDLDSALQTIWMNNASVRKAASALKARNGLTSNIEATEEVLADMRPQDLAKLSGWRRVVKAVRDWMSRVGANKLAARIDAWLKSGLSDQQQADLFVADLVTAARDWVKNGKGRPYMEGTLLADGSLAEDVAAQEKWLTAEAKARRYASIDEMAEKNYPLFEKLAALWREKNPVDGALLSRGIQSRNGLSTERQANRTVDGTELKALRRAAAILERPRDGVFLRVTEDGRAIASGPKGVRVPDTFIRFARDHSLAFEARRNSGIKPQDAARYNESTATVASEPMPGSYREAGAMYFGEGKPFVDRTGKTRFSRPGNAPTASERADQIISKPVATWRPIDAVARTLTHAVRLDALTAGVYDRAARLLDRYTPEAIKAGVISDYGIPEAVLDERTAMQGRMRVQLRKSGELLDKMATLTRAESRVAYEWMNNADPQALSYFEAQLPPESVKVMEEVKAMIDALSQEAVALKQLDPEAFKRNRFEYLRRSYVKHTAELTKGEMDSLRRAIAILGDQYKGRGMTDAVDMAKFKNVAPEWWGRKLQEGKADKGLKGERFVRLERRAPTGEGVMALETAQGPGDTNRQKKGRLLEVAYWPAGEAIPVKYSTWDQSGTWEVVDAKGGELIVWRDFTKQERISMGEIDEARYAIAKTLHSMIHDIETGRYLEWLATTYAKKPGELIDGKVVEASERMRDVFKPGEWVKVPETKVAGTSVAKYGLLAGRYLPGPIWNDVRQTVGFRFKPLGETYAAILGAWKTSKTALSPAVHTNNVMANFVMADWHDVTAGHIVKALRIILGASQRDGRGAIGRTGNVVSRAGIADAEAAREIINRFLDSGANLGSWVTAELQKEQLEPLLKALENEVGTVGQTMAGQVGAMVAVQKALQLRFPSAWDAFKPTRAGQVLTTEAKNMIDLYEAEDQVFRLAAWLRAKEGGSTDAVAGKVARRSFLDYHINAPWIQAMRSSALPFISFTYRAVPMMLEVAAKKPHKIMKLALAAAAINALGYLLSGGDEDDERRLLPEEKAGRVWGLAPKLVRMPWNDANNSPVFLDIRRFVPVGDVFDIGQNHAALPLLPVVIPGGPLAVVAELVANRSQFTGRAITLETDTPAEQAEKVADHIYKAFAPNIVILPGTYAWTGVSNAATGRTDSFGREQSPAQATASAFGVKLGSYPKDVLQLNAQRAAQAKIMEIDRNITQLKREYQHNGIDSNAFEQRVESQQNKKRAVLDRLQEKMGGN